MLRRNGPVIKPWSQSWGRKGVYGGKDLWKKPCTLSVTVCHTNCRYSPLLLVIVSHSSVVSHPLVSSTPFCRISCDAELCLLFSCHRQNFVNSEHSKKLISRQVGVSGNARWRNTNTKIDGMWLSIVMRVFVGGCFAIKGQVNFALDSITASCRFLLSAFCTDLNK